MHRATVRPPNPESNTPMGRSQSLMVPPVMRFRTYARAAIDSCGSEVAMHRATVRPPNPESNTPMGRSQSLMVPPVMRFRTYARAASRAFAIYTP